MRHHVVIGDGATAAEFACTARLDPGDRLTIVGPEVSELGRGLAYSDPGPGVPWRDAFLLNSPAGSVDPDFPPWLAAHWRTVEARMTGTRPDWLGFGREAIAAGDHAALFAPRAIYGDYLRERTEARLAVQAGRGVRIDRRAVPAIDLARQAGQFRVTLAGGESLLADSVDVATGGPAVQRYGQDDGPTAFNTLYGNEDEIAACLSPGLEILCIGANAAMLDVLRLAQSVLAEGDIRLAAVSATGLLPEALIPSRPRTPPVAAHLNGPFDTATDLLKDLDRAIAEARAEGATMTELRPGFKTLIAGQGLEALLPSRTERRKVGGAIERRFRRGTHDSIADFHRLRAAGQIRVILGAVTRVHARAPGEVDVRIGGADITAPLVVNCSGAGDSRAFDLLTTGLVRHGWLRFDAQTGGISVGPGLQAELPGLRYLSPAVTEVGDRVLPFPLYDISDLRALVAGANTPS